MTKYKVSRFDGEVFDSFEDAVLAVQTRIEGWKVEHGIYIMDAGAEYATRDAFVYDTPEDSWVTLGQWYKNDDERWRADTLAAEVRTAIAMRWAETEAPRSVINNLHAELCDDGYCYYEEYDDHSSPTMEWLEKYLQYYFCWYRSTEISSDEVIRKVVELSEGKW